MPEPLTWRNDADCIQVAEFVIDWIRSDLDPESRNTQTEAKNITLYAFLSDILVCVDGEYAQLAKLILNEINPED